MKLNLTTTAIASVIALSTLAVATQALAEQEKARTEGPYTTVEGWEIYAPTDRLGCMMERVMDNGLFVRMGKVKETNKFGYLAVYTQDENLKVYGDVVGAEPHRSVSLWYDGPPRFRTRAYFGARWRALPSLAR